ncbi:MAG: beta-ketoacyl synthase N-terminal-like domain-containing protein [Saprospiraceae bacterium]
MIGISGWGSISALGSNYDVIRENYLHPQHLFKKKDDLNTWCAALSEKSEQSLKLLQQVNKNYASVDRSVLMAMYAAEQAVQQAGWSDTAKVGVNIGSSRGATDLWEQAFQYFSENSTQKLPPLTSPTTTLGNIATWVAHHLRASGFTMSHSVTCSTALHAVLNAVTWLESGRCERFLAGGSEAPLTPFTIAQMKALRIYAGDENQSYPCRALDLQKNSNTMVLGEGAACFALEKNPRNPLAWIAGLGFANEKIETATSTSEMGLSASMQMALQEAELETVDVLVCHAPGTRLGDTAEIRAVQQVFGKNIPFCTSNKWKIGHTLGASGAMSLEAALMMFITQQIIKIPYLAPELHQEPQQINTVMVNATGFGGNAVSVILKNGKIK